VAKKKSYKMKRRSSKKKSFLGVNGAMLLGSVVYGAARQKVSNMLMPLTQKIPLGAVSDEVGMFGVAALTEKFVGRKIPVVKDITKAAKYIELARVGEAAVNGQINLGFLGSSQSSTSNGNIF
jgi:hypothetical protein